MQTIIETYQSQTEPNEKRIDAKAWNESAYRPVPTIIEAAEALYAMCQKLRILMLATKTSRLLLSE